MRALLAALLVAAAVRADPIEIAEADFARHRVPPTKVGLALGVAGGATGFADAHAANLAGAGAFWEVRATLGTRLFLAPEAAYVGSTRAFTAPGVDRPSSLVGHGLQGVLRLQYPWVHGAFLWEPFAFGGIGWTHLSVTGRVAAQAPVLDGDDLLVVPLGAGLMLAWNGLVFEGRFTWRQTFNEDLIAVPGRGHADLESWAAGGMIGYEF